MYEAYFGLTGKPFQLNPDPGFFFGSKGHKRALAYLEYGVHQADGFIVITGEVGAGKTTLAKGLIDRLPADAIVAAQIVSSQIGAEDLLRLVAQAFGIARQGAEKSALLTDIRRFCLKCHQEGRRALLIVDEAQNLSPKAIEELRMLSNFQVGTRSLVQSFLIGQPELRMMLQHPQMAQLKQRIIASYHLGPMEEEETRQYIEHRLRKVGWRGDPAFDEDAFVRIHALAEGIPRRINGLCDRLMLATYLASGHAITAEQVDATAGEITREFSMDDVVSRPVSATGDILRREAAFASGRALTEDGEWLGEPEDSAGRFDENGTGVGVTGSTESGAGDTKGGLTRGAYATHATHAAHAMTGARPAGADRLEDLDDRISALEESNRSLQQRLTRAIRLLDRVTGGASGV